MKKQQFFLSIIILIITVNCSVNKQLPLEKVDPPVYKGFTYLNGMWYHGQKLEAKDTLYYIKSNVERNLLLSLILRYPYEDVFYSNEYVDPFTTSKKPFSRFHNYKAKRVLHFNTKKRNEVMRYKVYDKERINHDMLAFMSFSKLDLCLTFPIYNVNFFDTAKIYGLTCKDTLYRFCSHAQEGPFSFYDLSTSFNFHYNGDSIFHDFRDGLCLYNPFEYLEYGSSDSARKLKERRYLIAFNQNVITHANSSSYKPHSCSKDILYLSKEFLKYDESVNYLRKVMQNYFNPDDPNTYIPYLKILAYSDYAGGDFVFVNKNKKRIKYKFYSLALKSYMQATITIAYPQSVKFKLLKR